ncbi:MAG TPA: beta-ketoacyl-[acyl-carrier-protein] synthase family protein [Candidatus Polarisedimenticolia bacterium]|jgi:3-oxoacyl-[acyl-carrier-protein] synthase II|nr:beta-ketoacyl-[acyl-carrier-protein] synthase family protein [Candidatus Polarisedimenticolia bacterium]
MRKRAVITGIGVVSPFGIGAQEFRSGLLEGRSATRRISLFDPGDLPCQVAAEVPGFDPEAWLAPADRPRVGRIVPMALLAAREALTAAGIDAPALSAEARRTIGVVLGSGAGAVDFAERQYEAYYRQGIHKVNPFAISSSVLGMVSSELSIAFGFTGSSHVLSNGCTSSTDALGYAMRSVVRGELPIVLCGGAEACITRGMLEGFCRMRAAATGWNDRPSLASRPFNRDRSGFVLGEGAWLVVLEEAEHARARGAVPLVEIAGYGATCDAHHRVHMHGDGEESTRAMALALQEAGVAVDEVDYINLHGTSTQQNDRVETRAVRQLLGPRSDRVPCSSTKSLVGHPQGACGAAGVVATAFGMTGRFLPPTINYETPDPECDLDYVPNRARRAEPRIALCNCIGFGSKNAALVLKRWDG